MNTMLKRGAALLVALSAITASAHASDCKIWDDFVKAQKKGKPSMLLDFSYAGYRHGEVGIPTVDHQVFNVCDYGAIPNDMFSDRIAIEKAIAAAEANGSGIIFFPKGRYMLSMKEDPKTPIEIKSSNIVFRGEGAGVDGSEIFMKEPYRAPNPGELWTSPSLFRFTGRAYSPAISPVVKAAEKGTFAITVEDSKELKAGDWICLRMSDNDPDVIARELDPYTYDQDMTNIIINGLQVYDYHQIVKVRGNKITFKEPLMRQIEEDENWYIQAFPHIEEVGVENLAFVGDWKEKFIHHKDDIHDGGWKFIEYTNVVNSWVRGCRFTDCSAMGTAVTSANVSMIDCSVTGNIGHTSADANCSSRVFFGGIHDAPAQWHSVGVTKPTIGTVIWRGLTNSNSCFESHASQPRATLFDACTSGLVRGRQGGAMSNVPNHMSDLVMWNYRETTKAQKEFTFWEGEGRYFRMMPPIIVGFHGSGTTFRKDQVLYEESNGTPVSPESLYEAQLELRLGKLPQWIVELREKVKANDFAGAVPENTVVAVSSESELNAALKNYTYGQTIELADGTYKDIKLIVNESGTFCTPLVIKAKNAGKVFFTGDAKVEIRGHHVHLSGIYFKDGNRKLSEWKSHGPGLVAIYGDYCEISDCMFYRFDRAESAYITTSLDENDRVPQYANIHHCAFIEKSTFDQVINLNNTRTKIEKGEPGAPMYHRISYCYFSNPPKKGNAGGGIRVGYWRKDYGRCLIDHNLFERQDSEPEIITSKSMENVYFANTFWNCRGTLNFRHGDKQVAINNFFIATDDKFDYGGMFVWGSDHLIASNFFNLRRTLKSRGNAAIYLNCGPEASEHALAFGSAILKNIFVETNGSDIEMAGLYERRVNDMGKEVVKTPYDIDFVGNQFYSEHPTKHTVLNDPNNSVADNNWVENIYNGRESGLESEIAGLRREREGFVRNDDSKIYVEDAPKVSFEEVQKYIPYTSIKGVDLDFLPLIKYGVSFSPLSRNQVGPRWCKKFPGDYFDTGVYNGEISNK